MMALKLTRAGSSVIIKNTPTNNMRLYKVKHLIEIIPITTPYGMPDKPENGFLKENGEFVAHNLLKEHNGMSLEEAEKLVEEHYKHEMDTLTLRRRLHERWYSRYDVL